MLQVAAELHCHTRFSDGWASPQACIRQAQRKGLHVLAITDHDTAAGGLPYWQSPLQDGVLVIPGEEISTDIGHVLAYFVRETIPPGPFETVIQTVREQGGLAFLVHPYQIPLGNHWRKKQIFKATPKQLGLLDGIEIINGHNRAMANQLAVRLAQEGSYTAIAGSDAHLPLEIGNVRCLLEIPEFSYAAVRQALTGKDQIRPQRRRWNAYGIYLLIGVLNKLQKRRYVWKSE